MSIKRENNASKQKESISLNLGQKNNKIFVVLLYQNEINEIANWEAGQYVEGRYLITIVHQIPQNVNSNKKYK